MSKKAVQGCHLKYASYNNIDPSTIKQDRTFTWVSFVGDSVLREVFLAAVQALTNYIPKKNWFQSRHYPLLGAHMGPDSENAIAPYGTTYHKSKLVCCRLQNFVQNEINAGYNITEPCLFAIHQDAAGRKENLRKHRLYVYSDMASYIRDFVDPLYYGKFKCVSFTWAPRIEDGTSVMKSLHSDPEYTPTGIIMNMGIYEGKDEKERKEPQDELEDQFSELISTAEATTHKYNTTYIYHETTYVHNKSAEVEAEWIRNFITDRISKWKSLGQYLKLYQLTKALHETSGCAHELDSIHILSRCNFQTLVALWDLNWLIYLDAVDGGDLPMPQHDHPVLHQGEADKDMLSATLEHGYKHINPSNDNTGERSAATTTTATPSATGKLLASASS